MRVLACPRVAVWIGHKLYTVFKTVTRVLVVEETLLACCHQAGLYTNRGRKALPQLDIDADGHIDVFERHAALVEDPNRNNGCPNVVFHHILREAHA